VSAFVLANSQLLHIIRETLARSRPAVRGAGPRTVFLPWFALNERESKDKLAELTRLLGVPLLVLPAQYSVTHDARLLKRLAKALCTPSVSDELAQALDQLPYSAPLEEEVVGRLAESVKKRIEAEPGFGTLAIAALQPGTDAESSVSRMLDRAAHIGVKTVLVLASKRPSGMVESINLPIARLRRDVHALMPRAQSEPEPTDALRSDDPSADDSRARKPAFYAYLLAFFDRMTSAPGAEASQNIDMAGSKHDRTDEAEGPTEDDTVADWADLLTRLSAANWGIAAEIADAWQRVGTLTWKHFAGLGNAGALKPDNLEERETLELRLRFVEMLRVLYPQVFEAAADELDGADQLYRILLILCGQTHGDSLVASSLLPFWQEQLDDPLFRELCYGCFNEIGRDRSLVPRIESRTQLYSLLSLVARNFQPGEASPPSEVETLFTEHREWLGRLAAGDFCEEPILRLLECAQQVLKTNPTATQALQAAQVLMSAYELLPPEDERVLRFRVDRSKVFKSIESFTRRAINQSRGAIRFDAALLRARLLAVRGDIDAALDVLRIMRRTVREQLSRCAMDVEEAFAHERAGDLLKATHMYEDALVVAERLGADELVARSANGCLRCDTAAFGRNAELLTQMRARIIVEIQSARALELFPLSRRNKPRVFISYRKECVALAEAIVNEHSKASSHFETWVDLLLVAGKEDFNPRIHQLLHDADAIVVLLSPKYFDSAWCVHELHFALGQNDVRGVPLYWAWCSDVPRAGEPCELAARRAFDRYLENTYGRRSDDHVLSAQEVERLSHQRAHVEERLDRLFARSRLLVNQPILNHRASAGDAVKPLLAALDETRGYLYRRAKLPWPWPDPPSPKSSRARSAPPPSTIHRPKQPPGASP
jgi:hypothetical protein